MFVWRKGAKRADAIRPHGQAVPVSAYSSTAPRAALVTSLAYRARYPVLCAPWAGAAASWGPK